MSDKTGIEWTDATWNPVRGCSLVSDGCKNCYAMGVAGRFGGAGQPYDGLTTKTTQGAKWTGKIMLVPDMLDQPIRWKRPRKIFVNSMSDLFHEGVPDDYIDRVFAVMALAPQHIFQVLTKRPERMRDYLRDKDLEDRITDLWREDDRDKETWNIMLPLSNVWIGVSVENQATADERIPLLLQTPASVRWLSMEPLLGPVDTSKYLNEVWCEDCDWSGTDCAGETDGDSECPECGSSPVMLSYEGKDQLGCRRRRERPERASDAFGLGAFPARPVQRREGAFLLQAMG